MYATGPDVSKHQGLKTNFAQAAEDGYDFGVVRLGSGVIADGTAEENVRRLRAAGMVVEGYWYDYPKYGLAQVDRCVEVIDGLGGPSVIKKIWWDVEEELCGLPVNEYRVEVSNALRRLEMAYSTDYVGIYTSAYKWGKTVGGSVAGVERFDLWTAHWTARMPPYAPYCPAQWGGHNGNWKKWQYAVTYVPWHDGGKSLIDLNRANMSDQEYLALYGDGPPIQETVPVKLIYPSGAVTLTVEEV